MDDNTFNNWVKIKNAMEDNGMIQTKFYDRACKCVSDKIDSRIPGGDEYYREFMKILNIA